MHILLTLLLMINLLIGTLLFIAMYRRRKVFQDRFASVLSSSQSSVLSLTISLIIYFLLPVDMAIIVFLTITISVGIGILFGSLVKFQSVLAGSYHGIVGGMMGTMLGAIVEDPTLCDLPAVYVGQLNIDIIAFSLFGTILVLITAILVYYALRV